MIRKRKKYFFLKQINYLTTRELKNSFVITNEFFYNKYDDNIITLLELWAIEM